MRQFVILVFDSFFQARALPFCKALLEKRSNSVGLDFVAWCVKLMGSGFLVLCFVPKARALRGTGEGNMFSTSERGDRTKV